MTGRRRLCGAVKSYVSLISFSFSLSLSLTHTQAQTEHSGVFCDGLFCSGGNMKHPKAFVSGRLHVLALYLCVRSLGTF